jgi:hypothetical protein
MKYTLPFLYLLITGMGYGCVMPEQMDLTNILVYFTVIVGALVIMIPIRKVIKMVNRS